MRYVSKERRGEKIWRGSCYEVVLYQYLGELWIFIHKVSIKLYIKKKKQLMGEIVSDFCQHWKKEDEFQCHVLTQNALIAQAHCAFDIARLTLRQRSR